MFTFVYDMQWLYSKRRLLLRATSDIGIGKEIFNCYGPHVGHQTTDERRAALRKQYFFDCTCVACQR
jgi:hypothetical protein